MNNNNTTFTKLFRSCVLLILLLSCSCSNRSNLYDITDKFILYLNTLYESYGIAGGIDQAQLTKDGKYKVFPIGRLINVRIEEVATEEEYKDLMNDLKYHYKDNNNVNDVYLCNGGTVMIDCRH